MREITIIYSGNSYIKMAGDALRDHGFKVYEGSSPQSRDVVVWGWRNGEKLKRKGHNVLVFERGYIGDRFKNTSIAWNGLNGHGDFKEPNPDKDRFLQHAEIKPWRKDGDYIVIMGQVAGDMSLQGRNLTLDYELWADIAENHYNKPVYFRPHPNTRQGFNPNIERINGDLQECLDGAHLVITYNSNSSVDAVLNGVPAVTMGKGSMSKLVTSQDVRVRLKPRRAQWAYRLASCQWSEQEIKRGDFIARMFCK